LRVEKVGIYSTGAIGTEDDDGIRSAPICAIASIASSFTQRHVKLRNRFDSIIAANQALSAGRNPVCFHMLKTRSTENAVQTKQVAIPFPAMQVCHPGIV